MIFVKKYRFIVLCIICNIYTFFCHELFVEEVRSLSELPLNKLIQLKTNLEVENDVQDLAVPEVESDVEGRMRPVAKQYKRYDPNRFRSIKRQGFMEDDDENKVSKIFNFALITLSFLAFGGYLLCLVISSIRRNSSLPNNVIVLSSLQNSQNMQNLQTMQKYHRPKRHATIIDPIDNDFDIDRMYRGMVMLSQGYVSYNQWR